MYRKTRTSVTIVLLSIIFSILFVQCQTSSDSNEEKSEWEKTQTENTLQAHDEYLRKFPDSEFSVKAKTAIEDILLSKAKTENPIEYFEVYVERFPEGKYLSEFETSIFDNITLGKSSLSYSDFIEKFPNSRYISTIDSIFYASAISSSTEEQFNNYRNTFPKGKYISEVDSVYEQLLYNKAVTENTKESFEQYLKRFPKTNKVKIIHISSSPGGQSLKILDINDSVWKTIVTPGIIKAIEGITITTIIDNPDFKTDIFTYSVTEEKEQKINRTLKVPSKIIVFEDFTDVISDWTFSTLKNKSEIVNDLLTCSVKTRQFQKLKKINMNLKENFEIEIKYKLVQSFFNRRRSYFGIIWGEETRVKFYFITSNGRYNYGSQSNNIGTENPNGYTGWEGYSETSDTWLKADNYMESDFNTIKIIKTGSKLQYYINDKYIHFENDMTSFRNNWAGYGIGNATVQIDYIRIKQYIE